jgi:hypothetical protein
LMFPSGVREMNCLWMTVMPSNVWGAFRALTLEFFMKREPYKLLFDEGNPRESARLQGPLSVSL